MDTTRNTLSAQDKVVRHSLELVRVKAAVPYALVIGKHEIDELILTDLALQFCNQSVRAELLVFIHKKSLQIAKWVQPGQSDLDTEISRRNTRSAKILDMFAQAKMFDI